MPSYPAREPDEKELRAREREMHEAQMREEARQRELEQREAQPEPQPEPRAPERAMPASQPAVARVDPREVLESAGLQMVETRPERVSAALPEPEGVPLGRPRRERPRRVAEDEPLVQVETKN